MTDGGRYELFDPWSSIVKAGPCSGPRHMWYAS